MSFSDEPPKQPVRGGDLRPRGARVLALVTDAFGGHGGIAKYNRDLLGAVCSHPRVREVVALPRVVPHAPEGVPERLRYEVRAASGKASYASALFREWLRVEGFDVVICGHINLLPLAYASARRFRAPLVLFIYGIDAWSRPPRMLTAKLVSKVDAVVSISQTTLERFLGWADAATTVTRIIPNAFDPEAFGPGPKIPKLVERYRLHGKRVIMTFGRMSSDERYKGFDEVLDAMPALLKAVPELVYMLVGEGTDRARLQQRAEALGLGDHAVFTGLVKEEEKADHYRLADAFVMPSRGEGFGFVFLEAMACGVPCVGSTVDGSREALREGKLGLLVDPASPDQVREGVLAALGRPRGVVPEGLDYFSYGMFAQRVHACLEEAIHFRS